MSKVFEILKMRIKDENGRLSDINVVEAFFTKYNHPHSVPYEILLKTKRTLIEGAVIDIQFLITDEKQFRKTTCKVSYNRKNNKDEPNEYILS